MAVVTLLLLEEALATAAGESIRTGLPVLLGSLEELGRRYPQELAEAKAAGFAARASLPVHTAGGVTLGAVSFGWAAPQAFEAPQLRRLDLIAQLTGLALERAMGRSLGAGQVERLPSALESMPNAFFSLDPDFRITYVNPEGERVLRTSREAMVGQRLFDVFPTAAGSEFERQYREVMNSGRPVVFEEYHPPFDSWFEVHAWPDPQGVNVYFTDISERHRAAAEAAAALKEAERANSRLSFLAEISRRLAGVRTRAEVFERLSRAMVPVMADWCTVIVPEAEELVRVAAAHIDPALDGLARRLVGSYPHAYSGPSPGVVAYRSAQPLRLARLAQQIIADLDDSVASAAYGRTLQLLGDGPGLLTPVVARGEVLAVLTMVRREGEPYSDADVAIMQEVALRAAAALDEGHQVETQRETASALQAAVLPKVLPTSERLRLAAGYRAASQGGQVGGDWYDAFELQGGRIALVVGDVAGHGVPAAAVMAQMRNALRAHLFSSFGPWESLARLSDLIATQEPEAFATVICLEVDPATGEVVWASAGHPVPMLVGAAGSSKPVRGDPAPPIGSIGPETTRLVEHRFTLAPGDRLLMFTDGLVERRNAHLDIGLTHLMILAEQTRRFADPERACETIFRDMLSGSHEDDVCLLIADFAPPQD